MKKIFFSGSFFAIPQLIDSYTLITKEIQYCGGHIKLDWVSDLLKQCGKKDLAKYSNNKLEKFVDHNKFFREHADAIEKSDMLIAEVSKPSLGVGYQVFYATHLKKPVLVLYNDEIEDTNEILSVVNIDSKYVTFKKYNKSTLHHIIDSFINKKDENLKKFNFIISEEIEIYLEWLEKDNVGKSKSELLRNKIIDDIILNDERYLKYKLKK